MTTTRATLLIRVRDPANGDAWSEFHRLYAPLLYRYARSRGLGRADAEEVRDQCMAIIARKIGAFRYNRARGGFKNWMYRIARGKIIDHLRRPRFRSADAHILQAVIDSGSSQDESWEVHWRNEHLRYCVNQVRHAVSERTYQMFCRLLFDGASVNDVCSAFGVNANQVYKAKSRVLRLIQKQMYALGVEQARGSAQRSRGSSS